MIDLEHLGEYAVIVSLTIFFFLLSLRVEFIYKSLKDPDNSGFGNAELVKYQKRISRDLKKLIRLTLWQAESNGHGQMPHQIKAEILEGLDDHGDDE